MPPPLYVCWRLAHLAYSHYNRLLGLFPSRVAVSDSFVFADLFGVCHVGCIVLGGGFLRVSCWVVGCLALLGERRPACGSTPQRLKLSLAGRDLHSAAEPRGRVPVLWF